MLTNEALNECKWGGFLALRRALEGKPNWSATMVRPRSQITSSRPSAFLNVAALATEHKEDLLAAIHVDPQFAKTATNCKDL